MVSNVVEEFSNKYHNPANTAYTRTQMYKALKINLNRKYKDVLSEEQINDVIENIMAIHGLTKTNFDGLSVIQRLIKSNINDVSIDDNSNKSEKTIASLYAESINPTKKIVGYDFLYRTLKEMYGKKRAKRLIGELLDYSLGISDSSNIMIPYCWALDASKLVTVGRDFGILPSKPCQRIDSYISSLCESIHQLSASHLAGAIAIGTFFLDITHLAIKMGITLDDVVNNTKTRKHFENEFQQFTHSVNHLSRNAQESPFTNLSIFGRSKIKYFITNDLDWYFTKPDWFNGSDDNWYNYCTEYVYQIQKIFISFFDKGDPLNNGLPYRFPVVTINMSKVKNEETGEFEIKDNRLLEDILNKDIYRYNIFVSEGNKTASCCRLLTDSEMLEMASQSNSFGAGALASLGSHRVCTINFNRIALECKSVEDFWKIYKYRIEATRDILMGHKKLLKILTEAGLEPFIKNGWISLNRLFSTFGILGTTECARNMSKRFGLSEDEFKKDILVYLNKYVKKYTNEYDGYIFNIEQIPAESFSVRLAKTDKLIFGDEAVDYPLYANQHVALWEDANIFERLEEDGKYNQLLTGGGIVHLTIAEKVSKEQARYLINHAVKVGCEHFALNATYSECENNHMTFGDNTICPECGGKIVDKLTRVVGFFVKVSDMSSTRREYDASKRVTVDLKSLDK
jgi:ribonucleoside-triphosphate reductase